MDIKVTADDKCHLLLHNCMLLNLLGDTLLFLRLILVPNFQLLCAYIRVCPKSDVLDLNCPKSPKLNFEARVCSLSHWTVSVSFLFLLHFELLIRQKCYRIQKIVVFYHVSMCTVMLIHNKELVNFFFRILLYGRLGRRGSLFIFALCSTRWVP